MKHSIFYRGIAFGVYLFIATCFFARAAEAGGALPSWNDGPAKRSIIEFVNRVTQSGSPDFVAPEERIATFDNDGTLWSEKPAYFQLFFAIDRVKALAPKNPEWKTQQPFKAVLDNDMKALAAAGEKGLLQLVMATHAGMRARQNSRALSRTGLLLLNILVSNGLTPILCINRCWRSSLTFVNIVLRPSSYPAVASNSCVPGFKTFTVFRLSKL
jgi:hypothetical protein